MKTLKPFWNYYGGKWRAALRYPEPLHDEIIEPFAGAAGYSLRYYERQIVLIDKDPVIVAVWQWLIDATHNDIMSLPLLGPEDCVDDFDLPDGARWLIGYCLGVGVGSRLSKRPSKWMRSVMIDGQAIDGRYWGIRRRDRIAEQVQFIKHWHVFEASYDDIPNGEATWFVDPPYQIAGKSYVYGSNDINFEHLGVWCREREGQVIVCENEGADWLPFRHGYNLTAGMTTKKEADGKKKKSVETIWTKGDG